MQLAASVSQLVLRVGNRWSRAGRAELGGESRGDAADDGHHRASNLESCRQPQRYRHDGPLHVLVGLLCLSAVTFNL